MMRSYIYADKFFYNSYVRDAGYLAIEEDGTFGDYTTEKPTDGEIVDYSGRWIAPGLVDTHIHGFGGADVMDNKEEALQTMSEGLLSAGVTSFLATTLTGDHDLLEDVARTVSQTMGREKGAKIRGLYFEGPYFTETYKGAQDPKYLSQPDINEFNRWQKAADGHIRKIALAPEYDNAVEFIDEVTKQGVTVSLGHSAATYEEAKGAIEHGASVFTHVYNGMRGFTHREPGMVGAAFGMNDVYGELICDGHHVHPKACDVAMNEIGRDHIAMISDCMRAGGMPDGDYMLGELPVVVKNGTARLKEGNLAGSILRLKDGVKNVVNWEIATVEEAIRMASYVPAKSCGLDDVCGQIRKGYAADFIVLTPSLNLEATYLDGQCRYEV